MPKILMTKEGKKAYATEGNYIGDEVRYWVEVTPKVWDYLDDHVREILTIPGQGIRFVRSIKRDQLAEDII